jgi:hypothetical protein
VVRAVPRPQEILECLCRMIRVVSFVILQVGSEWLMEGSVSLECIWRILNLNYTVLRCTTLPIAIAVCISESWVFISVSVRVVSTPTE